MYIKEYLTKFIVIEFGLLKYNFTEHIYLVTHDIHIYFELSTGTTR
jgi:hypothetical protein